MDVYERFWFSILAVLLLLGYTGIIYANTYSDGFREGYYKGKYELIAPPPKPKKDTTDN